ncbi:gluconolactonase [Undibacterium sp. KW1]|uniref:SMP-30/gluconolactonase/LRE family protein n=1 Tax=Undibacterium sp. KW1 TaxID=2058624 RepID=UPI001331C642|nr:SMP-30/gluconolactonase/LRE family protein [Undibacterium sp. KW1]BBB58537.1 gluconolactonase [Undibacterium sp. KW1]
MPEFSHIESIPAVNCIVGESPLWHAEQAAWYWVDIPAKTVWKLDARNGRLTSWLTTEMVACIALKQDGDFIAGMESGLFNLHLGEGSRALQTRLAAPAELKESGTGMRFNDGRCDRQGRFWSGTMFMDMAAAKAIGNLYRYSTAQGLSEPVVSNLLTQNGLAWSPDGKTMYLSDSHPASQTIWAFDYDMEDGMPHNKRVFADMKPMAGRPDGAAMDIDGCYWICGNDGACLLRFTPAGKLDRTIALPMNKPAMCTFGGPDMSTLLVSSIGAGKAEHDQWAGSLVLVRPGVAGVPETRFAN